MTPPIHHFIAAQELEITQLRQALVVAGQYNTAFPNDPAAMPAATQQWIVYRIQYLMALQTQIIGANVAPAVVAPADVPQVSFSTPLAVPSNASAPIVSAPAQGS